MATEKFNLSVLDLKGLFCDVLARHLNDGTLTREFVADMKNLLNISENWGLKIVKNYLIKKC